MVINPFAGLPSPVNDWSLSNALATGLRMTVRFWRFVDHSDADGRAWSSIRCRSRSGRPPHYKSTGLDVPCGVLAW